MQFRRFEWKKDNNRIEQNLKIQNTIQTVQDSTLTFLFCDFKLTFEPEKMVENF